MLPGKSTLLLDLGDKEKEHQSTDHQLPLKQTKVQRCWMEDIMSSSPTTISCTILCSTSGHIFSSFMSSSTGLSPSLPSSFLPSIFNNLLFFIFFFCLFSFVFQFLFYITFYVRNRHFASFNTSL